MITLVTPANLSPFSSHCCDAMMQAVCNYLVVVVVCTACVFMLGLYEVCNNKCHEISVTKWLLPKNILQKYSLDFFGCFAIQVYSPPFITCSIRIEGSMISGHYDWKSSSGPFPKVDSLYSSHEHIGHPPKYIYRVYLLYILPLNTYCEGFFCWQMIKAFRSLLVKQQCHLLPLASSTHLDYLLDC